MPTFAKAGTFGANWLIRACQSRAVSRNQVSNAIEDIKQWPSKVYVAERPGYHCGAFVKPDGQMIGKPSVRHFRVALTGPKIVLSQEGSLQSWQAMVRTFAQGQVVYTTLICAAFVGPLLELFPGADNVCLWLEGNTSVGKSTGLDLFCSAWGAPHQQPGSIGFSLRSTSAGLEQQMMARAACSFPADEVNQLGPSTREQGQRVFDLAFMVSHGAEKQRYNDPAAPKVQQAFLATSNLSPGRLLIGQDDENMNALLARFIIIPADAGTGHGAFDKVPNGHADSAAAVMALKEQLTQHYGSAADAFLARLIIERSTNEPALVDRITRDCAKFVRWANVDRSDREAQRRLQSFAMIYAAGRLALRWKIIPLQKLKTLLLEAHRRSEDGVAHAAPQVKLTAEQHVEAYVSANHENLRDLDRSKPCSMTKKELDGCAGFLKTIKGRRYLLVRARRWNNEFRQMAYPMLDELLGAGRLYATEGKQSQKRVRANKPKDRIYAVEVG